MLEINAVSRSFGALRAVDAVSLRIARGEIVGLVGENGAGKTTLMRMVAGELQPATGSIAAPPRVELVHQHFMLVGDFTVAENLVLARGGASFFLSPARVAREAEEVVASSGLPLPRLDRRVSELSVGEMARVEMIKALSRAPDLLILDEPTSVLTPIETEELFAVMRRIAADGATVVFISHKLPEVLAVCSRVVVMRTGAIVADTAVSERSPKELAEEMIGRRDDRIVRASIPSGSNRTALEMSGVSGAMLDDVSLTVQKGEIVAIAGVAGNGQQELAAVLRGINAARNGSISIAGFRQDAAALLTNDAVAHVPEDRTRNGLVGEMSIAENIALRARRWRPAEARRTAERLISLYDIRARGPRQPARELSGGNQQKVILAREIDRRPELIIAAEPTRGLDVAATNFVHAQLRSAAANGAGVLLISSDLDEAFALGDAIHVIYRGRLSERLLPEEAPSRIAQLMAGMS